MTEQEIKDKEVPLPIDNTETLKAYQEGLFKAKLLYENVSESQLYQYAILSNGDKKRRDFHLIYASSVDKQFHITEMQDEPLYFLGSSGKLHGGVILTRRSNGTIYKFGLMGHNGKEIIAPIWNELTRIQDSLLLAQKGVSDKQNEFKTVYRVYDIAGNTKISLPGDARVHDRRHNKMQIVPPHLEVFGEKSAVLFNGREIPNMPDDFRLKITAYVLYKNEVYNVADSMASAVEDCEAFKSSIILPNGYERRKRIDSSIIEEKIKQIMTEREKRNSWRQSKTDD